MVRNACLIFLTLIVVSFVSPVAAVPAGPTPQDLLQSVEENFAQIAAAKVITRTSLIATEAGRQFGIERMKADHPDDTTLQESYASMPLESVTIRSFLTDGIRYREEDYGDVTAGDLPNNPPDSVVVFDGESLKSFNHSNATGLVTSQSMQEESQPKDASLLFAYQKSCKHFIESIPEASRLVECGDGSIEMELLLATGGGEYEQVGVLFHIDFNLEKGGLISSLRRTGLRVKKDGSRHLTEDFMVLDAEFSEKSGIYYPCKMVEKVYLPDLDGREDGKTVSDESRGRVLGNTRILEALEVDFDPVISEDSFELVFPRGTQVVDKTLGDVVTVGGETQFMAEALHSLEAELAPGPSQQPASVSIEPSPTTAPVVVKYSTGVPLWLWGVLVAIALAGCIGAVHHARRGR